MSEYINTTYVTLKIKDGIAASWLTNFNNRTVLIVRLL